MKSSTQVKTTWRMCLEMENNGRVIWAFCINVLRTAKKKKKWIGLVIFVTVKNSLENLETSIVSLNFYSQHVSVKSLLKSLFYLKHLISDWNKNPIQACLSPKPVLFPLFHITTINVILMASRACFPSSY